MGRMGEGRDSHPGARRNETEEAAALCGGHGRAQQQWQRAASEQILG